MLRTIARGKRRGEGILLVGIGVEAFVVFEATTLSGPLGSAEVRLRGAMLADRRLMNK